MPYTNLKYEISKWLEKLRKSTKNSVRLADIPTKFRTKHFLSTHQNVFTMRDILFDSEHNADETIIVAVRTHCMNNLCKVRVFYITNEMQLIQCSLLLSALYMFRAVFPPIIRSI